MVEKDFLIKSLALKGRKNFISLRRDRQIFRSRVFVVYFTNKLNLGDFFHYGLVVTKKVGNAVVRNRVKRRIKEVIRASSFLRPRCSCIIFCKSFIGEVSFPEINKDLSFCLKKILNWNF